MYSALLGLILLPVQTPDVPDVGQRVIAELRNGYRIEGVLIEKDRRSAVLSLESGELRLDLKRVSRFHLPGATEETPEKPAGGERRLSVSVPSSKAGGQRLAFSVPRTWKEVEEGAGALTFVAPQEDLRFRLEESADPQSLWKITNSLRQSFSGTLAGFEVKQERFGNRWAETRTWEIDFEYDEEGTRYRERRLYLDFGRAKRVFVFRARQSSFPELVGHFERIASGLVLEDAASPTSPTSPARPAAGDSKTDLEESERQPAGSRTPESGDVESDDPAPDGRQLRTEDIERALEDEIRQALEGPGARRETEGPKG